MINIYITFLIGNGFDLNLGLDTKYSDFYKYFEKHSSNLNMIKQWSIEDKSLWSDLELQLGKKVSTVNEQSLIQFYDDKNELDELLMEYLEEEQERFVISDKNKKEIQDEFSRSIKELTKGFTQDDLDSIKDTKRHFNNEEHCIQFINYNYTDVLDRIVESCKKDNVHVGNHEKNSGAKIADKIGNVFHVHGTVEKETILGVNDISQIENEYLRSETIFKTIFVKKHANDSLGQQKTSIAQKMIDDSYIICIFGMSTGATDQMWWEDIVNWLLGSSLRKLVIFRKENEVSSRRAVTGNVIIQKNRIKDDFLKRGKGKHPDEELDRIRNQIIVIINSEIFSFPKVN